MREKGRAALKTQPIWPCTGRGLPSPAGHPADWWALTPPFHPYPPGSHPAGGIFSVALSLRSPPVAVSDLPALRCPDFPPRMLSAAAACHPAAPPRNIILNIGAAVLFFVRRLLKNSNLIQAAQKAPDARRQGARNEAYFVCTPQLPQTMTTKQMEFFEQPVKRRVTWRAYLWPRSQGRQLWSSSLWGHGIS